MGVEEVQHLDSGFELGGADVEGAADGDALIGIAGDAVGGGVLLLIEAGTDNH